MQPRFDLDGRSTSFGPRERAAIRSIHRRVAEDFAPFRVDVTTADPGSAALNRTSSADTRFGTRVLISPARDAARRICDLSCGGVAYIGSFDLVGSAQYQPAWVFPPLLSFDTKAIAEAVSHEAGHNLGLRHDGTSRSTYYRGHHQWAPIMGSGYDRPVVQWSRGEYAGADNPQDDLAVIRRHGLPLRADDHGDDRATASPLVEEPSGRLVGSGIVTTEDDRDVFALPRTCGTRTSVVVAPAATSPDLDVRLRILDPTGRLAEAGRRSATFTRDVASEMHADHSVYLPPGDYAVEVQGAGAQDARYGYSDYASLGAYDVRVSGCAGDGTSPRLTGRSPDRLASGVSRSAPVWVSFDEPVRGLSRSTFVLRNTRTGRLVGATVRRVAGSERWVLDPNGPLAGSTRFVAGLLGGPHATRDLGGNPAVTESWGFTTRS